MKQNTLLLALLATLLAGCSYQLTTYQYDHEVIELPNRDFYYTAYNLRGNATVSFKIRQGRTTNGMEHLGGLIAAAKQNLMFAHPLGPNESYVNWSVDQITTESGTVNSGARFAEEVEYTIVVSADVIRFGLPPEGYEKPAIEEVAAQPTSMEHAEPKPAWSTSKVPTGATPSASEFRYAVGDSVLITFRNNQISGVIQELTTYYGDRPYYLVEFPHRDATQSKWFFESEMEEIPTSD